MTVAMEIAYTAVVSVDRAGYFKATLYDHERRSSMGDPYAIEGPSGYQMPQLAIEAAFLLLAPIIPDDEVQQQQAEAIARPQERAEEPLDFVEKQRPANAPLKGRRSVRDALMSKVGENKSAVLAWILALGLVSGINWAVRAPLPPGMAICVACDTDVVPIASANR